MTAGERSPALSLVRSPPKADSSTMSRSSERMQRAPVACLWLVKDGVELPSDARLGDVFQRWSRTAETLERLSAMLGARPWRISSRDFARLSTSVRALTRTITEDPEPLRALLATFADSFFAERVVDFDLTIDRFEESAQRALLAQRRGASARELVRDLRAFVDGLDRCLSDQSFSVSSGTTLKRSATKP